VPGPRREERRKRYFVGQASRRGQARSNVKKRSQPIDRFRDAIRGIINDKVTQEAIAYRVHLELYGYEPIVISRDLIRIATAFESRPTRPTVPKELPERKSRESFKRRFVGWTRVELKEYAANGSIPLRFRDGQA